MPEIIRSMTVYLPEKGRLYEHYDAKYEQEL
jgi:hypothetical protein